MKKYLLLIFALTIGISAFSKKVKFAVSMKGVPLNVTGVGIHVEGTFQTALGAPANWDPAYNPMIKDVVDTNLYTLVVDLPANQVYEYKYLNGDQTYDVEFIPQESRVQYLNIDSRWIYLDSTANDTTFIGVIPYSGNHPQGTYLMRLKMCLPSGMIVNANGIHVAGNYDNWDITKHTMYSFDGQKFEYIAYVDSTIMNYEYKFANGNSSANYETVPTTCATNSNRTATVSGDVELDSYEFNSCSKCVFTGIDEIASDEILIYPNPANQYLVVSSQYLVTTIEVNNIVGQIMNCGSSKLTTENWQLNTESLPSGMYFLKTISNSGKSTVTKFSVQH
jgi:hypothetical protein